MARIIGFEKSIDNIMQKILTSKEKPYVVSICGQPNRGKTNLRKILLNNAYKNNKHVWSGMDNSYDPPFSNSDTDCCLIEDLHNFPAVSEFSKEYFGKEVDLRVYLVVSRLEITPEKYKEYDIIILNPNATVKRP